MESLGMSLVLDLFLARKKSAPTQAIVKITLRLIADGEVARPTHAAFEATQDGGWSPVTGQNGKQRYFTSDAFAPSSVAAVAISDVLASAEMRAAFAAAGWVRWPGWKVIPITDAPAGEFLAACSGGAPTQRSGGIELPAELALASAPSSGGLLD